MELSNNEKECLRERLATIKENLKLLEDQESAISKSLYEVRGLREKMRVTEKALRVYVMSMDDGEDLLAIWDEETSAPAPIPQPSHSERLANALIAVDDDDLPF